MEYQCSMYDPETGEEITWTAYLYLMKCTGPFLEFTIEGRGSSIHGITGPHVNGHFLCLPAYNVGSELGRYDDTFWNWEHVSPLMNPVDATTVVTGLQYLADFN